MTPKCYQTLPNGQRCSAPAMNGSKYCRHHDPQRPPRQPEEESNNTGLLSIPRLVDKPSILAAVNEVLAALGEGRIKRSAAETFLAGIKLANRLINEIAQAADTATPTHNYSRPGTLALAASFDRPRTAEPFNPARVYPSHAHSPSPFLSDVEPAEARMIKELMAQAREMSENQTARR